MKISLKKESIERFKRLQKKIPKIDENQIIDTALICLEQKTDKILGKKVIKKVKELNDKGLKKQEIADYLNKKNIPAIKDYDEWKIDIISEML